MPAAAPSDSHDTVPDVVPALGSVPRVADVADDAAGPAGPDSADSAADAGGAASSHDGDEPAGSNDSDSGDQALNDQAVFALRAVMIASERYRAAVANHFGIGSVESVVLSLLSEAGQPLTPHQIGARMLLSSGTVTAILDRLERAGCIRRTQHPTDRRSRLIVLTPAGRRVLHFSNQHMTAVVASSTDGPIGPDVLIALRRIGHLLDERTDIITAL